MSETKNAPPRVGRWYRVGGTVMQFSQTCVLDAAPDGWGYQFDAADGAEAKYAPSAWGTADVEQLGTTGQRFAALEERIAALEARLLAPPAVAGTPLASLDVTLPLSAADTSAIRDHFEARSRACHVDHDACSAEQRSGTGRAAQGTCVRGVVDLVAASADDQHAAERGTPAAGAEVTASEGGDTARADSVVAELREVVNMLVEADRQALNEWRAAELAGVNKLRARLAEMRADLERERVRADYTAHVSAERRKWATAIASALDGADLSGCESFVSREEMAARVAAMRAELERERKLRRESEEAFKAASDPRSGVAQKRGLVTGARVRSLDHAGRVIVCGKIVGWDEDGDPEVEHVVAGRACTDAYYADLVELDTEATT